MSFSTGADGGLVATLFGDTSTGGSDEEGSCSNGGRQLIYRVTVPPGPARDLVVSSRAQGALDTLLYVRASPCVGGAELVCRDEAQTSLEVATARYLEPGDYFVFVASFTSAGVGPTEISMSLSPSGEPPPNDTCASPELLFEGGGDFSASLVVDTERAVNDEAAGCGGSGNDRVYRVVLSERRRVRIRSRGAPAVDPVLSLRRGTCAGGPEVSCADKTSLGGLEVLDEHDLPAGTYFLIVDTASADGPQTLSIEVGPPLLAAQGDSCNDAIALLLDGGSSQAISGATVASLDDYRGACVPDESEGRDLVYRFSAATERSFSAVVLPSASSTLEPALYLVHSEACLSDGGLSTGAARGCITGVQRAGARLNVSRLPAGSYVLVVDGLNQSEGEFTLNVSLDAPSPPSTNDACATAAFLPLVAGAGSAEGNSLDAGGHHVGSEEGQDCSDDAAEDSSGGHDLAYRFTTPPSDGGVSVRIAASSENAVELVPTLFLRAACDDSSSQLNCASAARTDPTAVLVQNGLAPGADYFVWLDSRALAGTGRGGPFTLQVDTATGPPSNDTCAGAASLPLNTSVPGTTLGAGDHFSGATGHYAGTACPWVLRGPDAVFSFTTASAGDYTVRVLPQKGFDVGVAVLASCGTNACLATVDDQEAGSPEEVVISAPASTTYYVVVDAYTSLASGQGGFVVEVSH